MTPQGVNIKYPDKLFIGGEWVAPMSGDRLEIVNPNSEDVVARTAAAGPDDMDRAVASARRAFDHGPWPATPPEGRRMAVAMPAKNRSHARSGSVRSSQSLEEQGACAPE